MTETKHNSPTLPRKSIRYAVRASVDAYTETHSLSLQLAENITQAVGDQIIDYVDKKDDPRAFEEVIRDGILTVIKYQRTMVNFLVPKIVSIIEEEIYRHKTQEPD